MRLNRAKPDIVRYREAVRLPQIDLAMLAGISRHRLWEFERGMRDLTADEKSAIRQALSVELHKAVLAAAEFQKAGSAQ